MKILALGSHYDDIEFGCGGTLIKERDRGNEIYLGITHADDPRGGDVANRILEQRESCLMLDACVFSFDQSRSTEEKVGMLDEMSPDILYIPFEDDYHQHHKDTAMIGFAVARKRNIQVLKYLNQSSHSCYPNYLSVIDIEKKKELVSVFKSQNGRQPKFMEIMEAQNRYFGSLVSGNGHYAEGFVVHRLIDY
jgi:LmbE family N-acetylglucosaminyl deacetylase